MIKIFTVSTALLFLFSCTDVRELSESVTKIKEDQSLILKKLNSIEKKIGKTAPPQANKNKPKADPNKVYDIAEAGSIVLGNPKAKVSIVKWTDFQ